MTPLSRNPGALAACLALAIAPATLAQTPAKPAFKADKVMTFLDANCLTDDEPVASKLLNGGIIDGQKGECLKIKVGTKVYYAFKPATEICTKKRAQGPVATYTAGSAGAQDCK